MKVKEGMVGVTPILLLMHLDPRQLSVGVDLRLASRANWLAGRDLVEVARWGHWMSEAVVAKEVVATTPQPSLQTVSTL